MDSRLIPFALVLTLLGTAEPGAQTRVRTETIKPQAPPAAAAPGGQFQPTPAPAKPAGRAGAAKARTPTVSEIVTGLSALPPPAARMRARIIEAPRTAAVDRVGTVIQSSE